MTESVQWALISVSDKTGIVEFATGLAERGIRILSTGGTAQQLSDSGLDVEEVSSYTGFPEMMGGRIKTLHPRIHGGILGRRGTDEDVMAEHGIRHIGLVVVNLYPFADTVSREDCTLELAIENIDIGGPTMVRAAAKNFRDVGIVVNPEDYNRVLTELDQNEGALGEQLKFDLAVRAFEHTAGYDGMIANYLGARIRDDSQFPRTFNLQLELAQEMRYGENPHQNGVFYRDSGNTGPNVAWSTQIQGKALSFNNIADTDAALECCRQFRDKPACVIVKHANPCGVAESESINNAYDLAFATDPESAFGGIIAFNQALDRLTAAAILERQFVEVIIAPGVDDDALPLLAEKKNVRVLVTGSWDEAGNGTGPTSMLDFNLKKVGGGLLVQEEDHLLFDGLDVVSERKPDSRELEDLQFAWKVAKFVKSNAIVYARDGQTIGVGAGQMSRVNSARIAAIKAEHAGLEVRGAVMASDAFFPFRDGLDNAAAVGIKAVIQPGGSMRDDEVIGAANEHGIAMIFTGTRHFRH